MDRTGPPPPTLDYRGPATAAPADGRRWLVHAAALPLLVVMAAGWFMFVVLSSFNLTYGAPRGDPASDPAFVVGPWRPARAGVPADVRRVTRSTTFFHARLDQVRDRSGDGSPEVQGFQAMQVSVRWPRLLPLIALGALAWAGLYALALRALGPAVRIGVTAPAGTGCRTPAPASRRSSRS